VVDVRFSDDGERVVSASMDGTVRVWRTKRPSLSLVLHAAASVICAGVSDDGERIAISSADGKLGIWSTGELRLLATADLGGDPADAVALSPKGDRIVAARRSGEIWMADSATLDRRALLAPSGHYPPKAIWMSKDGDRIVASFVESDPKVWNRDGFAREERLHGYGDWARLGFGRAVGTPVSLVRKDGENAYLHTAVAAFSPDGKNIAIAEGRGGAHIENAAASATPIPLAEPGAFADSVAFSQDGTLVVASLQDNGAHVASASGNRIATLPAPEGFATSAFFSPDAKRLMTLSPDGKARLWALDRPEVPVAVAEGGMRLAAFTPDGKRFVTVSNDGTVRVRYTDVRSALWRATPYCLSPQERVRALNETQAEAAEGVRTCRAGAAEVRVCVTHARTERDRVECGAHASH
jgi:WD40 repeat protein